MSNYPDSADIRKIKKWKTTNGWRDLIDFVEGAVWLRDYGRFRRNNRHVRIATGGWSGNEEIVGALSDNLVFWATCWLKSERGGLHVFRLPSKGRAI